MFKVCVTELGYIGVGVRDMDAWRAFASDILGLECVDEADGLGLRMDYWHHRIIVRPSEENDLQYAGFRVAGPEEFLMMQAHLRENGVAFEVASMSEAEDRCVLEFLRLQDPAGMPIEIFHGPRVDRHRPFRPGRGMHGRFVTGSGGLGHLVIRDVGTDLSYRFYSHILGMRGSVEARVEMQGQKFEPIFMHCNDRDHTVAFGFGPSSKRVHHLLVEVDNMDDVGLAYDLARSKGLPILITPGKHSNDQEFSFYVQTPSGWFCEYGYGGAKSNDQSRSNTAPEIWGHDLIGGTFMK